MYAENVPTLLERTRSGYPRKTRAQKIADAKRDIYRFYDTNPAEYRAAERRLARLLVEQSTLTQLADLGVLAEEK